MLKAPGTWIPYMLLAASIGYLAITKLLCKLKRENKENKSSEKRARKTAKHS